MGPGLSWELFGGAFLGLSLQPVPGVLKALLDGAWSVAKLSAGLAGVEDGIVFDNSHGLGGIERLLAGELSPELCQGSTGAGDPHGTDPSGGGTSGELEL